MDWSVGDQSKIEKLRDDSKSSYACRIIMVISSSIRMDEGYEITITTQAQRLVDAWVVGLESASNNLCDSGRFLHSHLYHPTDIETVGWRWNG